MYMYIEKVYFTAFTHPSLFPYRHTHINPCIRTPILTCEAEPGKLYFPTHSVPGAQAWAGSGLAITLSLTFS